MHDLNSDYNQLDHVRKPNVSPNEDLVCLLSNLNVLIVSANVIVSSGISC
jgi:hypothetical protein